VAFLSGDAANVIFEKSDEEIVKMCVDSLHKVFPEEVRNDTIKEVHCVSKDPDPPVIFWQNFIKTAEISLILGILV